MAIHVFDQHFNRTLLRHPLIVLDVWMSKRISLLIVGPDMHVGIDDKSMRVCGRNSPLAERERGGRSAGHDRLQHGPLQELATMRLSVREGVGRRIPMLHTFLHVVLLSSGLTKSVPSAASRLRGLLRLGYLSNWLASIC